MLRAIIREAPGGLADCRYFSTFKLTYSVALLLFSFSLFSFPLSRSLSLPLAFSLAASQSAVASGLNTLVFLRAKVVLVVKVVLFTSSGDGRIIRSVETSTNLKTEELKRNEVGAQSEIDCLQRRIILN